MSTVQEIEAAIGKLSDEELLALVDRLRERFAEARDRQIEIDVAEAKRDFLAETQAEFRQGKTKPLDKSLGND